MTSPATTPDPRPPDCPAADASAAEIGEVPAELTPLHTSAVTLRVALAGAFAGAGVADVPAFLAEAGVALRAVDPADTDGAACRIAPTVTPAPVAGAAFTAGPDEPARLVAGERLG